MAAGPGAAALLADHGANVIKIETPSRDPWRRVLLKDQPKSRTFGSIFEQDNRGKRSICLDLNNDAAYVEMFFKRNYLLSENCSSCI